MASEHLYDAFSDHVDAFPNRVALEWLDNGTTSQAITYAQLATRAETLAKGLRTCTAYGDRVLLALDMSLDFIAAFLACQYAGRIAVPIAVPPNRESEARTRATQIWRHSDATRIIVSERTLTNASARPPLAEVPLTSDVYLTLPKLEAFAATSNTRDGRTPHEIAFLQYTSGTTSKPKGVIVQQSNLLDNLTHIRERFAHHQDSVGVIWLPAHHDMGLVGGLLQPLYTGFRCILMSPLQFVQRPLRWLEAISEYRATTSGGPCFAYDLCLRRIRAEDLDRLDLSSWSVAFVGAEKVRAAVMRAFTKRFAPVGFRSKAITPCYGLAEATLMVSSYQATVESRIVALSRTALAQGKAEPAVAPPSDARTIESVSCGRVVSGHEAIIVDPKTHHKLPEGHVGELWLRGPSVAQGYFADPIATASNFGAQAASHTQKASYLRTGDQAFFLNGELHICGRYKNTIIIRGKKYSSEDIEQLLQTNHAVLVSHGGAAFGSEFEGEESLVIVHELERAALRDDLDPIRSSLQKTLGTQLGLKAADIVFVLPASLPRTTSGKLQHATCRELYRRGELRRVKPRSARHSSRSEIPTSKIPEVGQ